MGRRTKFEDIGSMALLYLNKACNCGMVSYKKVVEFDNIINNNLDQMKSNIDPYLYYDEESILYFSTVDETGEQYLVINPNADKEKAMNRHIGCLPLDIVIASQMENALDVLNLQLLNGSIIQKNNNLNQEKNKKKVLKRKEK